MSHPPKKPPQADAGAPAPERAEYMDVSRVHAAIMREKDEPVDGYEPVPAAWLGLVMVLAMWGGCYLGSYNMGFRADALEGSPIASGAASQEAPKPLSPMALGKRTFNNCMACHQATGTGVAGQFPPLAGSEWVEGDADTLVRILLQGLEGPLQVLGKTYNGAMPAWGSKLSDAQIGGVLTYIRGSWGNKAGEVSEAEVAQVRAQTGARKKPWSEADLRAARKP